jgi:predicted transcriptional regulator
MQEFNKFFVRLRPDTRRLLDRASVDMGRSRASLIDEAVKQLLSRRYSSTVELLDQMIAAHQ